ncbi:MAG: hypothetical protein HW418_4140 [Anaerolineales bacterium]|nr:hypothetical protein [Anaerolineales bacterium]
MNAKRILCASLVLFALLALTAPAWAGGWAVVTLDTLPTQVVAGQPFSIGFIVRQHGQRPMEGLAPTIILYSPGTRKTSTVTAKAEGAIGHYTAEVTFPSGGTWDWSIDAFGFAPQPMPRLTVLGAAPAVSSGTRASLSLPTLIGFIALIAAGGALVLLIRTRAAWAAALTLVAALVCVVSFAVTAKNATARAGGLAGRPRAGALPRQGLRRLPLARGGPRRPQGLCRFQRRPQSIKSVTESRLRARMAEGPSGVEAGHADAESGIEQRGD